MPPSEVPAEVVPSPQVIVALSSGHVSPPTTLPVNDCPSTAVTSTPADAAAATATITRTAASAPPRMPRRNLLATREPVERARRMGYRRVRFPIKVTLIDCLIVR